MVAFYIDLRHKLPLFCVFMKNIIKFLGFLKVLSYIINREFDNMPLISPEEINRIKDSNDIVDTI